MPKNVRNFWLDLQVDGRKHRITTGPRKADGGFMLKILLRDEGAIGKRVIYINGVVKADGTLSILATDNEDREQVLIISHR